MVLDVDLLFLQILQVRTNIVLFTTHNDAFAPPCEVKFLYSIFSG